MTNQTNNNHLNSFEANLYQPGSTSSSSTSTSASNRIHPYQSFSLSSSSNNNNNNTHPSLYIKKPFTYLNSFISTSRKPSHSIQIAILILISLSTLTILIDYWTQSQLYRLRYPWTLSPAKGSSPSTSSWKSLSEGYLGLPACDPFGEPGTVVLNTSFYHDASWVPFGPSCAPSPDYLSALRAIREVPINLPLSQREALIHRPIHPSSSSSKEQEQKEPQQTEFFDRSGFDLWGRPYPDLTFLRGKTILLLGDSVDRNSLEHLHQLVHADVRSLHYLDINNPPPSPDWDPRSTPWEVNLGILHPRNYSNASHPDNSRDFAGLNCKLLNGFFYGLDDIDEFSVQADWHGPGLAESRVRELYEPLTGAYGREDGEGPAFIMLQSGLWDLAFFGRRNRQRNETTELPLGAEELDWWQGRFRSLIRTIKYTWPDTPLWIRTTHRIGEQFWAAHDWQAGLKHGLGKGFVNFFPDHRVHQIRQMQLFVAKEEGLPVFDFYNLWEGYQKFQDKVHPLKVPGGVLMNQALFHHVWMESIGRKNWDPSYLKRNRIGKLPHHLHEFY
ncbi:hypothetical protein PGT21_007969 [Puccinia graminis f. sp. tritici]|uniref:Uncharacterized protein n=1 Tax=Puccinia graminis f. sp. tritici TaxID=56615 RepID=A0A5B0RD28_PUCGR|nr:hypothetical protein PGT21_007969 [Puccinia graminis f. sp. tritici]KAA1122963.1 hypothetical protein PGTUg99_008955 [Puccinia graminis f. sp. tritici]